MDLNQLQKKLLIKGLDSLPLVNYEPAVLKEWPTDWHIEYRVLNPDSGKLERRKFRFEKIRKRLGSDPKARKYAKLYCDAINEKLDSGWNPYQQGKNAKSFHKLLDALKVYLKEKELDLKNGVYSPESMRTCKSQIEIFSNWIKTKNLTNVYVGSFTKDMIQEYLDHVYIEKELSPRTWNNYLKYMRAVWNWLISKNYCSENIVSKIKTKPVTEKERVIIPPEWTRKIMEYYREHNPKMELICGLVYNSFMRPSEICRTQIKDIRIIEGGIFLPGNKTKNGHARWCLLPPHLIEMLTKMKIETYPLDYYLISSFLEPGNNKLCTRKIDKYWDKMRTKIGLPKNMKLYSYRDTGITDLKKAGYSNLFISSITGHLNSEEIETYTHAPDPKALKFIMEESYKL
ncbi:MAG: site-specific integrase [Prevotella sp.]|jgi:integrase|nr:site-specific integrase [Prevotella sp.]